MTFHDTSSAARSVLSFAMLALFLAPRQTRLFLEHVPVQNLRCLVSNANPSREPGYLTHFVLILFAHPADWIEDPLVSCQEVQPQLVSNVMKSMKLWLEGKATKLELKGVLGQGFVTP